MARTGWQALFFNLAAWFPTALAAALPAWTLEVERLTLGDLSLADIQASSPAASPGQAGLHLRVATVSLAGGGAGYGPVTLDCPGELVRVMESFCQDGNWVAMLAEGWPKLQGTLVQTVVGDEASSLQTRGSLETVNWTAAARAAGGRFELTVEIPGQPLATLGFLASRIPALDWVGTGQWGGKGRVSGGAGKALEAGAEFEFAGVDFDSPDGLYAGLGVGARLSGTLDASAKDAIGIEAALVKGELLLRDFYRDFSGRSVEAAARLVWQHDRIDVQRATLSDGDALFLAGQASIPLSPESGAPELWLRELNLTFPEAYTRYLEPVAAVLTLDGLETSGALSWTGDWSPGTARSGELRFDGLSLRDVRRGRFGIESLDGTLRTGTASRLTWGAAAFERLDLGAGSVSIGLSPESLSVLEPLRIGVFGGHLVLQEFSVAFPRGTEADIQLRAELQDIEMQQMSGALGWPEFSGTLSGSIPGVNWAGGVIEIEGALEFRVFNGQVVLSDLRVERPFGVLPSLAANITATSLDLEQLTNTFEFGRIAGRLDGYVRDLRMLDWQPVQFDAWFGTPEGAGKNDISRQAVRHLTTIGGGSPTTMLTGPVLRLFNNFSYRRLGLGCLLRDNICLMRGIEEQGEGVLLLEGAGIPKISILAYNRAVDWPQLVAELTAVTGGEEVRIGD